MWNERATGAVDSTVDDQMLPALQGISPRALALLLMGSHHPIITRVWRSPRKAWTVAARRLEGVEDFMTGVWLLHVAAALFSMVDGLAFFNMSPVQCRAQQCNAAQEGRLKIRVDATSQDLIGC